MLCLSAQEPRVVRLLVADGPEELVLVAAVEGGLADHHLVEEDAERPPVDAVGVLQTLYDLPLRKVFRVNLCHVYYRAHTALEAAARSILDTSQNSNRIC